MSSSPSRSGVAALIVLSLVWGYTWVAMKEAVRFADPFDFSALRAMAGGLHSEITLPHGDQTAPEDVAPEGWVAVVRPGRVLYELEGVTMDLAKQAFHLAEHKLSVRTRLIGREQVL